MDKIYYRKRRNYKYFLSETYNIKTYIYPKCDIDTEYCAFRSDGSLRVFSGYGWDGPSGPTVDTKSFMRGSLVHDVLYQLMREGHLPRASRGAADKLLKQMCIEDGMSKFRAAYVYASVRVFAGGFVKSDVIEAP